jgi:thioredoxin 1
MKEYNDSNFEQEVINAKGVVVVDFWAQWCAPCRALAPVLETIDTEMNGRVTIGKVNIDTCAEVPVKYGIRSIPTLLFFKDGQLADKAIGVQPKEKLVEKIEQLIQ